MFLARNTASNTTADRHHQHIKHTLIASLSASTSRLVDRKVVLRCREKWHSVHMLAQNDLRPAGPWRRPNEAQPLFTPVASVAAWLHRSVNSCVCYRTPRSQPATSSGCLLMPDCCFTCIDQHGRMCEAGGSNYNGRPRSRSQRDEPPHRAGRLVIVHEGCSSQSRAGGNPVAFKHQILTLQELGGEEVVPATCRDGPPHRAGGSDSVRHVCGSTQERGRRKRVAFKNFACRLLEHGGEMVVAVGERLGLPLHPRGDAAVAGHEGGASQSAAVADPVALKVEALTLQEPGGHQERP